MTALGVAIEEWQGFYAAVAGVGATLVGLVYVGTSIHLGRHPLDDRARLLATMAGVNLLYPVLTSLVLLMPVQPSVVGGALLLIAAFAVGASLSITRAEARHPGDWTRQLFVYRYLVPLATSMVLATGAVGLLLGYRWSLAAPPVFVLVMFVVGADNAWDLLLGRYLKRSFVDVGTRLPHQGQ